MDMHSVTSPTSRLLVVIALAITWFAWGSSFIAIHYANAVVPPLLMMGTRFLIAGGLVALVAVATRRGRARVRVTPGSMLDALIVGGGMVTVGMGLTGWAANRLDSGTAALVMATVPVWMTAFAAATLGLRPHRLALAGIAVGVAGISALLTPGSGHIDLLAVAALTLSNAAWAGASLFATRAESSGNAMLDTGLRMLVGGTMLCGVSAMSGELRGFDPTAINGLAIGSWAYLVVLCSVIAFVAYEWLVRNTTSTLASTHAFVNPAVAVLLGALVLHESITIRTVIAGAGIVGAVTLLVLGERRTTAATTAAAAAPIGARTPARSVSRPRAVARRPIAVGRVRPNLGFDTTPTPAFAARRAERPWAATDGMDALAIDVALDRDL
jgi:drug/metabolite transporter (DMT)-like permease